MVTGRKSKKRKSSEVQQVLFPERLRAPGAGRPKKKGKDARVSRKARPEHEERNPMLITSKVVEGLPNLCEEQFLGIAGGALHDANERGLIRVVMFKLASNHIHMVCEAADKENVSRGLNGLFCANAKGLNKALVRTGSVWNDRYDRQDLTTPKRLRNAIRYVVQNAEKHTKKLLPLGEGGKKRPDTYSSGAYSTGWAETNLDLSPPFGLRRFTADPLTWLLREGWKRAGGLISIDGVPAST